jgi:hypothetical protein
MRTCESINKNFRLCDGSAFIFFCAEEMQCSELKTSEAEEEMTRWAQTCCERSGNFY